MGKTVKHAPIGIDIKVKLVGYPLLLNRAPTMFAAPIHPSPAETQYTLAVGLAN